MLFNEGLLSGRHYSIPGFVMDGTDGDSAVNGLNTSVKENSSLNKSPRSPLSRISPQRAALDVPTNGCIDTSIIEQLCDNINDMRSSGDQSPSRLSMGSDGEESRIDSELRHLVVGEMRAVEIMEEEVEGESDDEDRQKNVASKGVMSANEKSNVIDKIQSPSSKSPPTHSWTPHLQLEREASKPTRKSKMSYLKPSNEFESDKDSKQLPIGGVTKKKQRKFSRGASNINNITHYPSEAGLDNPDLGPYLLKLARDLISSGDNPQKALEFALRATEAFEKCEDGKPSLELVMSLHVVAVIYCNLGQYSQAVPVLEHSIEIPILDEGHDHALAKFSGYMQLGDTYAMLGQLENSILCYSKALDLQKQVLGEMDPRVGETCRYLAEAHVQALQFVEAEKLCQMALDIHRESGAPASLEEATDRRLMGIICDTKGDHEAALEHLVLASTAMVSNGQETEVASVDCSIGDAYLSLARYDEAVFAFQKALTVFKSTKGENHPAVASVYVRLADLCNKTGKLRDSKSYCDSALQIYEKPIAGTSAEEIANGLTDISGIYESMSEPGQALKLLRKALNIYNNAPGNHCTVAGIEAQMAAMYYMIGNYAESYGSFKNAIAKLRASGEKKSAFFGMALNQMGLACVQRYAINEAADHFEEARSILEQEYGPYHQDTLGVYSNLAGAYDAMGRLDEAIEILEYVVRIREEKLGTANPEVDDEKRRLAELLKEAGRVRNSKGRSLEALMDTSHVINRGR